jgi:hypothetical protein
VQVTWYGVCGVVISLVLSLAWREFILPQSGKDVALFLLMGVLAWCGQSLMSRYAATARVGCPCCAVAHTPACAPWLEAGT